jgi:ABC-type transporter Mla subunit MlaD
VNLFTETGLAVQKAVLFIAGLLKQPETPGLICLLIVLFLFIALTVFWRSYREEKNALLWMNGIVGKKNPSFSSDIDLLHASVNKEKNASKEREALAFAWGKYRETLVHHEEGGALVLRNSVRPSAFINLDDLGFGPRFSRVVPGLFVSTSLFLTFLGLVSALNSMADGSGINSGTMTNLLSIASAKFIMSLTGLLCSIVFTIVIKNRAQKIQVIVANLCSNIEENLSFISLEDLAAEQLIAIREQREHFRLIGMELVAELGRPLREELPVAISKAIANAMDPLLSKLQTTGVDNVGAMVKDLSSQFTEGVGKALADASSNLSKAGDRLASLSDRMDQSSGKMGFEMESAVGRLALSLDELHKTMQSAGNDVSGSFSKGAEELLAIISRTLDSISKNTEESSRTMKEAVDGMVGAAEQIRLQIGKATENAVEVTNKEVKKIGIEVGDAIKLTGATVENSLNQSSIEVLKAASEFSTKLSKDLLEPLAEVADGLNSVAATIKSGTSDLRHMSDGVKAGAEASQKAAGTFDLASNSLIKSIGPIRETTERIQNSLQSVEDTTKQVGNLIIRSSELTAKSAQEALQSAVTILTAKSAAVNGTLDLITEVLGRLRGQGERLDTMDEKLGHAFDRYTTEVEGAVDAMREHFAEMVAKISPALDTLREVVSQAEEFRPKSGRP